METVRILVIDDHPLFAETLAARLGSEPDLVVPAIADGADRALGLIEGEQPSMLLLDYKLGRENGLNVLRAAHRRHPAVKVIMLSATSEAPTVVEAMRCGAKAWVPKSVDSRELIRIIRLVARGGVWLPEECLGPVLERLLVAPDLVSDVLISLTARERQILQCTVDGVSRADIATSLFLSPNTVRTHTQNLLAKLHCHSLLEAVALARRNGMQPNPGATPSSLSSH
ncbi:MAG: hypothetical protein QOE71_2435 [Pseudonocardiales bacterium]|jgi:DNA-binding NarL/FixJ family response regulator|nr:hypothetical protein [Pseudonocardiales bacterium]MDQ1751379.1 hypothetical protein [Pseudonocardiales bacterium]